MFDATDLNKAIQSALTSTPDIVPPGKRFALVAVGHLDGSVQAVLAERIGEHWQLGEEVSWHGGAVDAGVSVKASWP